MVTSIWVHDVYRVTTYRPGRGHIVAAARQQFVIVTQNNQLQNAQLIKLFSADVTAALQRNTAGLPILLNS